MAANKTLQQKDIKGEIKQIEPSFKIAEEFEFHCSKTLRKEVPLSTLFFSRGLFIP